MSGSLHHIRTHFTIDSKSLLRQRIYLLLRSRNYQQQQETCWRAIMPSRICGCPSISGADTGPASANHSAARDPRDQSQSSISVAPHSSDAQGFRQGQSGSPGCHQPIRGCVHIVLTNQRRVTQGPDLRAGRDMCRQLRAPSLGQSGGRTGDG